MMVGDHFRKWWERAVVLVILLTILGFEIANNSGLLILKHEIQTLMEKGVVAHMVDTLSSTHTDTTGDPHVVTTVRDMGPPKEDYDAFVERHKQQLQKVAVAFP